MTTWPVSLGAVVVLVMMALAIEAGDMDRAASYGFGFLLSTALVAPVELAVWAVKRWRRRTKPVIWKFKSRAWEDERLRQTIADAAELFERITAEDEPHQITNMSVATHDGMAAWLARPEVKAARER